MTSDTWTAMLEPTGRPVDAFGTLTVQSNPATSCCRARPSWRNPLSVEPHPRALYRGRMAVLDWWCLRYDLAMTPPPKEPP
jgi:hypothetical protein